MICIISLITNNSIDMLPLFSLNISVVAYVPFVAECKSTNNVYATETIQGYLPVFLFLLPSFE